MAVSQSYHEAKSNVEQLVQRSHRSPDAYQRSDYRETQARVEFVVPFFEALGKVSTVGSIEAEALRDLGAAAMSSGERRHSSHSVRI